MTLGGRAWTSGKRGSSGVKFRRHLTPLVFGENVPETVVYVADCFNLV